MAWLPMLLFLDLCNIFRQSSMSLMGILFTSEKVAKFFMSLSLTRPRKCLIV